MTTPITASDAADETQQAQMPLSGHLAELRNRLIWSILAIGLGSMVGFYLGDELIAILRAPLPPNVPLILLDVTGAFSIRLQVSLVVGVVLAMPVILFHVWRFVAPGLTASERRSVLPWIPISLLFFLLGVSIAYIIMPFAVTFLLSFVLEGVDPTIQLGSYFSFVTSLFLAFGILMEFPILLIGLSRVNIVTSELLSRSRRMVILVIALFSAVATPGGDLVSPTILGVTLYILFEATVLFIRRTGR
jgi:sec-independent protein translocase protein TatC